MTDIEKAAREYAVKNCDYSYGCPKGEEDCPNCQWAKYGFKDRYYSVHLAGAQSRQSEIDELRAALKSLCDVVGKLNDTNVKKHYSKLVVTYGEAAQLLKKYEPVKR